jgi:hypothetical protein
MAWFLLPALQPFTIAAATLLALVLIEIIGSFAGASLSDMTEATSIAETAESGLSWLNLGRVPLLVLLMLLLGLFSASGMVLQAVANASVGLLPPLLAVPLAGAFALMTTGAVSKLVGAVLPREETYALNEQDLVGRIGTVTVGPLESHAVGRISIADAHGSRHFPRARPANAGEAIEIGARVLIVDMAGREYRVIRAPAQLADGENPN